MQQNYNKKGKLNKLKASLLLLMMVLFALPAVAQQNIYMHTGSRTLVGNETVNFYDSGGESSGPAYYWERWFSRGEDYIFTFKPATGKKIKVTFKQFTAYTDNNEHNPAHAFYDHPQWALRVNNGELSIYNGLTVNEQDLITSYTGSVIDEFTVIADGAMTFHFVSGYREEGWEAEVTQVDAYTVQKPSISFQVCDDQVVLNANSPHSVIYYTTDGTDPSVPTKDPLSAGILYEGPFPVAVGTEIRAIACDTTLTTNNTSGVAKLTYTSADVTPTPGKPSITRTGNTITMEPAPLIGDINETYTVYYKTEENGAYRQYTAPIEWNTPHTTFYAITKPVSCSDKISADTTLYFDKVQVPDPTIEFTDVNTTTGIGTVKITCAAGYVISYTTDGSDPTTTNGAASPITLTDINPGTTIKAIAYKDGNTTDYQPSNIVTLLCIPGGDGQSGAYGSVVILDDRENHDWTYYSDEDSPIHSLKPADIKITYKGYGAKTMTKDNVEPTPANSAFTEEVTADKVAVNINEAGNQFIYFKTLENADPEGSGTNYPYTMIPNPFQKRPTGQSNGSGSLTPTSRTIVIVTSSSNTSYYDGWDYGATLTVTCNGQTLATIGSITTTTVVAPVGGTVYLTFTAGTGSSNQNNRCRVAAYYDSTNGTSIYSSYNPVDYPNRYFTVDAGSSTSVTYGIYRGFYAWRVKSLSSGLSIQDPETRETYGVNSIIYADQEVEFVTANQEGNEVEFEALWAQALLNSDGYYTNSGKYQNAYERNFKRVTSLTTYSGGPVTISSVYPDGSETTVRSVTRTSDYSCSEDVKLENMTLAMPNYYLDGNNHSLIIGRGVANGTNNVANRVYGEYQPGTTKNDFVFRVESGRYGAIYGLYDDDGTTHITNSFKSTITYGSDYDRAKKDHSKLIVAAATQLGYSVSCADNTVNETVLSGTFGNNATADIELYMGWAGSISNNSLGTRKLEVFDGNFKGGIAGGIEQGVDAGTMILTMRIHGGTVPQYVYQSGQYSAAYGSRRTIITGGTFEDWIAGGCYGTGNTAQRPGTTNGDVFIYFGGDAEQTASDEGIFGAGYGDYATASGRYNVNKSYIVVADEAQISGSVYGGGNNGYCMDGSEVYVKGVKGKDNAMLNIAGSVYGGANLSWTEGTTIVTVKEGTITGSVYGGAQGSSATTDIVYVTDKATVNVEGGTMTNVYGGGLGAQTRMNGGTEVNIKGGTINNNVYGGGALGTVPSGDTHVNVSGGTMKDVYGAGQGGTTTAQVSGQTYVNVTGGTIANVYGGGEAGDVVTSTGSQSNTKNVVVTLNGNHNQQWETRRARLIITSADGTLNRTIYWERYAANAPHVETIAVPCDSEITVTYYYNPSYYPTGLSYNVMSEDGTITYVNHPTQPNNNTQDMFTIASDPVAPVLASTVTIAGANISGDVFGGGKMGKTGGNTQVDIESGNIRGNVFGGAYGASGSVFVAGMHTVNIMGGRVFGNVYGGSRNANDALVFNNPDANETATNAVVNISAGQIDQQVYAAGYFGQTYGSVYAFIGKNAILNAPNKAPSFGDDNENKYKAGNLRIADNIWAGGDWGVFESGTFGAPTVSGYSNIYVDGDGYNTETTSESAPAYMNIGGSLLGCGTSCDAGKQGRTIMVRNYGKALESGSKDPNFPEPYTEASRTLYSIQRADTLIIDNSHINFTGLAQVNSIEATAKYAIYSFDKTVRMTGGSSLFMNAMTSQIIDFWSASCDDVYLGKNASYTPVVYNKVSETPNKIRVNGGNYIEIYHDKMPMQENGSTVYKPGYGMLNGFAYMMVAESTSDNTCAYARPKQCQDTPISNDLNNSTDGGWVSYDSDKNTYDINGNSHAADGVTLDTLVQMPYENHVNSKKNGEQYFRIWRAGGVYSEREAVVNILADGTDSFGCVAVSVKLPAWKTANSYYKFQTQGDAPALNTTVDYGADLNVYNSALTDTAAATMNSSWIHYTPGEGGTIGQQESDSLHTELDYIRENPNVSFGLVTAPGLAMSGNSLIVCGESDPFLAQVTGTDPNWQTVNKFTCGDFEKNPEVTFMITYSNLISTNMTWDPMYVTLVQMDENGNEIDIVKIAIVINTATTIDREFTTQVYAVMNKTGSPNDSYTAKVVLPTFDLFDPTAEHNSQFTVTNVSFEPKATDASPQSWQYKGSTLAAVNKFAMEVGGSTNEDNTDGWNGTSIGMVDSKTAAPTTKLGEASGRMPFALDFRLTYDGTKEYTGGDEDALLGVLTFTLTYDNVPVDDPNGGTTQVSGSKTLTIHVEIIRRGTGNAFYLDGQNGSNGYEGTYPDRAVLSLSTIYNRLGFMPGDIVYVVNTVDVAGDLEWIGTRYDHVDIYRYPGGHTLKGDSITGNPDNVAFKGQLLNIKSKGKMNIRDIVLDGHNDEHHRPGTGNDKATDAAVTADAPLINVASGGILTLTAGAQLQNNTSTTNGGAVMVEDGGILKMNVDATIRYNQIVGASVNGGAVYMAGEMIASDSIQIDTNYKASAFNNLFLASKDKMLTIGTTENDDFDMLASSAHIGITKTEADEDGWYRVVNVTDNADIDWLEIPYAPRPNDIIFHDGGIYQLEKHTSPLILYWVGTWVTRQYWNPEFANDTVAGYNTNMDYTNIDTREKLAWLISMVNGENDCTANDFSGKTVYITADIDMSDDIWVPIGTTAHPFKGTFEGNGHVINGVRTPLVNTNVGMMGYTQGATISDAVVNVNFTGNSVNQGTVIGTMNGGSLNNVEAAGNLNGLDNTLNMGGLVGKVESGTIHSSFAVNTMTATVDTTVMGGLVGVNGGDLYNSYANATMAGSDRMGGLVGENKSNCRVENCYVILGEQEIPAFAYLNNGIITYCYAENDDNYVGEGSVPTLSGTYDEVKGIKEIGYMYDDNKVTAPAANTYAKDTVKYENNHTVVWNGLLSVLNQWVKDGHTSYSTWNRPTTQEINGDLPILAFPKDNCLGTSNGKFLVYSAFNDTINGLDNLLGNIYEGQSAYIYLYQSATGVVNGTGSNHLFIHEDAALLQAASSDETITATVGVTFDNSKKTAKDFYGDDLGYDWHLFSSPLIAAPMGTEYGSQSQHGEGANITKLEGNYLPNGLLNQSDVKWDLYTYFEPQYHWINFKRGSDSHWHYDDPYGQITYPNESTFTQGQGYLMAISQDSYLNNTGTLTKENVTTTITAKAEPEDHGIYTYDKGSNLVGNPYHAYLDLWKVYQGTGFKNYYIYDAESGKYMPFAVGQSENDITPSRYIHPHQGFFVLKTATPDEEDFTITYAMASATKTDDSYFRGDEQVNYPLVNLFAENERGNRDIAIIEFNRPEIGGAVKVNNLRNANFKIAAHLDGQSYALLFTPEGTERVPVRFTTEENGTFTLTWQTLHGDFTSLLLVDNMTGTITDMLRSDHYTFDATTEDYASRFYITYRVTDVDEMNEGDGTFAYFDGSEWVIEGQGTLDVVDVLGRTLYSERLVNDKNRVSLNNVAPGVYLMRVSNGTNTMVQKIVVRE